MKNLALGIFKYSTLMGEAFGWRLVEVLPWTTIYAPNVQPVRRLATSLGYGTRKAAIDAFSDMRHAMGADPFCLADVVDVPQYGWAARVPS